MKNLVIRNTEPRLVELPSIEGFTAYRLVPGENDVPEAYWVEVVKNPAVKLWLACRVLVNQGEGKAASLVNSLDELHPDVAIKHIGNCDNVAVLNAWKVGTQTLGYKQAIDERIGELVAGQTGAAVSSSDDGVDPFVEATLTD